MADSDTGLPGAIVSLSRELYHDGKALRPGMDLCLTPEQFDKLRSGYLCPPPPHGCLAHQREAFPEKCLEPYCNFNLKRDLSGWLERAFAGEQDPWPTRRSELEEQGVWLPPERG